MPTREVFGNILPWMQTVFYLLMAVSIGVLLGRVGSRVRLWCKGVPGDFECDWRLWVSRLWVFVLCQKRVRRRSLGALLHLLLFSGFLVLTIGTTLLAISHWGPVDFHHGLYYLFYELTMDVFGVAFCLGCVLAMTRRLVRKPAALGGGRGDVWFLGLMLALGLTGFVLEALRLKYTGVPVEWARWSIVGWGLQAMFMEGLSLDAARALHLWMWWLHAVLIAVFFALIPVSRMLHVITGPLHIATRPRRAMGTYVPVDLEEVEETGIVGVGRIEQFNRRQLLSLDACMECGRCEEACPAYASGKPLSPKQVVLDLKAVMSAGQEPGTLLPGDVISHETLMACTSCQACVQECPVLIDPLDLITQMRRYMVAEGQVSGAAAQAMRATGGQGNPYGRAQGERMDWAEGLDVPTVESNSGFEVLYWVGCAASYDPRAQRVARSLVQLLRKAGVNFAVLGPEERCTGDPARRFGDELLFQDSAEKNVQTLNAHAVKRIVTACPHCFHSLSNEYPQFDGVFHVQHHSELLSELVAEGKLRSTSNDNDSVTLHDPCYLARTNGIVDAPREVLRAAGVHLIELPRCGKKTFCCGAGGGRMWLDEQPSQRVSRLRANEVSDSGAQRLATACPFCLNMMSDAMGSQEGRDHGEVLDIAELLLEAQSKSDHDEEAPA